MLAGGSKGAGTVRMTSCLHRHHRALWEPRWPCSRIPIFRCFHFSSGVSLTAVPKQRMSTPTQLISQTPLHPPPTSAPISTSLLGSTACRLLPCSLLLWVSSGLFWAQTHVCLGHPPLRGFSPALNDQSPHRSSGCTEPALRPASPVQGSTSSP